MENELQTTLNNILNDKNTNLVPENLKAGITCLGIEGTMQEGIDTSDATATASEIKLGKTAYVNGEKITGTLGESEFMSFNTGVNTELLADLNQVRFINEDIGVDNLPVILTKNAGLALDTTYDNVANAIGLTPEKLAKGNNILGVEGTAETGGIDTSDANAIANDIAQNKTAYVNGENITGTLPLFPNSRTFTVDGGVTNDTENNRIQIRTINTTKQILDNNLNMEFNGEYADVAEAIGLTAEKIVQGNTILGVEGTGEVLNTSDATATVNDLVEGKTAYINGEKITGVIPEYKSNTELGEQYFIASKFEKTGDGSGLLISGHNSADGLFRAGTYLGVNIGTEEQSQLAALIGLTPEKIKSGETILGITGTYTGEATE